MVNRQGADLSRSSREGGPLKAAVQPPWPYIYHLCSNYITDGKPPIYLARGEKVNRCEQPNNHSGLMLTILALIISRTSNRNS